MPEIWRLGRKSGHNIYLQTGAQPSDADRQIGVMFDPERSRIAIDAVNASEGLDRARTDRALRVVIAHLDWDLHKELERDEKDGDNVYGEIVARFITAYAEALDA